MIRLLALLAPLWLLSATPADALLCNAILGCSCDVVVPDIKFDDFVPLGGAQHNGEGTVTIDCTGLIELSPSIAVKINGGTYGTISQRKMRSAAANLLNYNLFTTTGRTTIWGDGTTGSSVTVSGGLLSLGHWTVSRTIFGRVDPLATTPPGSYSDTVVVRIDW